VQLARLGEQGRERPVVRVGEDSFVDVSDVWPRAIEWLGRLMALVRNKPYVPNELDGAQQTKEALARYRQQFRHVRPVRRRLPACEPGSGRAPGNPADQAEVGAQLAHCFSQRSLSLEPLSSLPSLPTCRKRHAERPKLPSGTLAGRLVLLPFGLAPVLLLTVELSPAGRTVVEAALATVDFLDSQLAVLDRELRSYARTHPATRALGRLYGVGDLTAVAIYAAVGDARRFSSARKVIRLAGLDVTVHESDRKRQPGRISRQGPPMLRWAAYEAGLAACRGGSPDHADYLALRERLGHKTACLTVSRRVLRRAYHALVAVGDATLEPLPD
jgi:hypothetical protein